MTTYIFKPRAQFQVSWTDPTVWVNGVVPNSPDADVIFTDPGTFNRQVISTDQTLVVNSIDLAYEALSINSALSVVHATIVENNGQMLLNGGSLSTGSLLINSFDVQGTGSINVSGQLINNVEIFGQGLTVTAATFANNGELHAGTGGLTIHSGAFQEFAAGVLTSGTYSAGGGSAPGTLSFDIGGVVTEDAATIVLEAGSLMQSFDPGTGQYVPFAASLRTVDSSGTLSLFGPCTYTWGPLTDNGRINLGRGTFQSSQLTIGSSGLLYGTGRLVGPLTNSGVIEAAPDPDPSDQYPLGQTGTLIVDGTVSGSGVFEIAAGVPRLPSGESPNILELNGAQSENVSFVDHVGRLTLDDAPHFTGTISPSGFGDVIGVSGFDLAATRSYAGDASGGTLTLQENGMTAALHFAGSYTLQNFAFSFEGAQANPTLLITIVSDTPSLSLVPSVALYTAGGPATRLQTGAIVNDPDGDLSGATIAVAAGAYNGDGDQFRYGSTVLSSSPTSVTLGSDHFSIVSGGSRSRYPATAPRPSTKRSSTAFSTNRAPPTRRMAGSIRPARCPM